MCYSFIVPPRWFSSQVGWSPIHHLMRRRTLCALSGGTAPGGPATSLPAFYLRLWETNDDHVDPDITIPQAIHKPPHQQHRRGFSFLPSYSGVYEAAPPDSPSSPCTTRTSADRRRCPSHAHVAQHPMPRDSTPAPMACFKSSQELLPRGGHEGSAKRKPQRAVGMHAAAPAALWAAWNGYTCAGAALLATFSL